ncbi:MAG: aminoacyl-tRNA hydrolase [Verrucomicrobiales bacterium]|nr:aminoacyl-tRNA hydrolase [Verrucomicrobiales bacterium]
MSDSGIRLIAGLGNPGRQYEKTRHNVGFEIADELISSRGWDWQFEKKWKAEVARQGSDLIFVKPQTYMNLSGESVAKIAKFFKIEPAEVLVIFDDVDLPLGKLRFRKSGSAGGHNGVKSIIQCLGTDGFPRLKFGIGHSGGSKKMVGHVLGKFSPDEKNELEKNMARAVEGVNCALSRGLDEAMNLFNQREKKPKPKKKKAEEKSNPPESDSTGETPTEADSETPT